MHKPETHPNAEAIRDAFICRLPIRSSSADLHRQVSGRISIARSLNHRSIDISLEYASGSPVSPSQEQRVVESYSMSAS